MAKYIKKEIVDLNGTGEGTKAYYRMKVEERLSFGDFLRKCSKSHRLYPTNVIQGVMSAVCTELAYQLSCGNSVKIDGLGLFNAKVGIKKYKNQEMDDSFEVGTRRRNAMSLGVTGVSFKADKQLVRDIAGQCQLERGADDRLRRSRFTKEERIERAIQYLRQNGFMHARDYASLNGLSQSTATRELRHDLHGSATITSRGEKSAKIYLLKEEPQAAQPPVSIIDGEADSSGEVLSKEDNSWQIWDE